MKRRLLALGLILLLWQASSALEWLKTVHGTVTATLELAADSTDIGLLHRDTSGVEWVKLDGDHFKLTYRTKTDSVMTAAEDSILFIVAFTPWKGDTTADTTGGKFYKLDSIKVSAPSTAWTYGYKLYNLYNDSAYYSNIIKIWMEAVDSVSDADSSIAGNSYDKTVEYWIEVYK